MELRMYILLIGVGMVLGMNVALDVRAEVLEKDPPTGNLTAEHDIAINPDEILPANRTMMATIDPYINDIDINDMIPPGNPMTIIIQSDKVVATNETVDFTSLGIPSTNAPPTIPITEEEDLDEQVQEQASDVEEMIQEELDD